MKFLYVILGELKINKVIKQFISSTLFDFLFLRKKDVNIKLFVTDQIKIIAYVDSLTITTNVSDVRTMKKLNSEPEKRVFDVNKAKTKSHKTRSLKRWTYTTRWRCQYKKQNKKVQLPKEFKN